jgi:hypothetical protein
MSDDTERKVYSHKQAAARLSMSVTELHRIRDAGAIGHYARRHGPQGKRPTYFYSAEHLAAYWASIESAPRTTPPEGGMVSRAATHGRPSRNGHLPSASEALKATQSRRASAPRAAVLTHAPKPSKVLS